MTIRKAVIPAAGFGTRFLPVTKSVSKVMLPIIAKPVIQYVVESAVASGIEQIILVTGNNKESLENYFVPNFELEAALERSGKQKALEEMRALTELAEVVFVPQKHALGNGDAVLVTKNVVGNENFLVLWGDDVLLGNPPVPRQLIEVAKRHDAPVVGVKAVPEDDFEKYGMLEVEALHEELSDGRVTRAKSVVEKPRRHESPSNLAQIGGFVLTPDIFGILESLTPGQGGEIWLADAINRLMQERTVYAYEFNGIRYDAGNKLDFLRATVELALEDEELGTQFRQYLRGRDIGL